MVIEQLGWSVLQSQSQGDACGAPKEVNTRANALVCRLLIDRVR